MTRRINKSASSKLAEGFVKQRMGSVQSVSSVLVEHYNLNSQEQVELYEAIEHSKTQMKINLTSANNTQRRLAVQFQRSFENLDDDTAAAILKLLNKEDN